MYRKISSLLLALAMLAGCGDDTTGDVGQCVSGSADCVDGGPVAVGIGNRVQDFSLPRCDPGGSGAYSLYGPDFESASLTVVSIGAGWCPPCIAETRELTERVVAPYEARGVRVIQVLVEDANYNAADEADCSAWIDQYGLRNVELLDPGSDMKVYWPDGVLPSTLIVDDEGVLRFMEIGAEDGLESLTATLDNLLDGP